MNNYKYLLYIVFFSMAAFGSAMAEENTSCVTQSLHGVRYINCSNGFSGVGADLGDSQAYAFSTGITVVHRQLSDVEYYLASNGSDAISIKMNDLTSYRINSDTTAVGQSIDGIRVVNTSKGGSVVSYLLMDKAVTGFRGRVKLDSGVFLIPSKP